MKKHHFKSDMNATTRFEVTPESAGWRFLDFEVIGLKPGEHYALDTGSREVALTPLSGSAQVNVAGTSYELKRRDVWSEPGHVLYVPPRQAVEITAASAFECGVGGAPAEGKYPTRLFSPDEMRNELRGGGAACRQVIHSLTHPLPAERLILYEVYVPGGMWSGIPPHCHDGYSGSPYLEEVYYYRITPGEGWAIHRNFRKDSDFDELFTVQDGDLVLVTQGFHPVATAPGSNVYFLNYLAGDLVDEARKTPPLDDAEWAWLKQNWDGNSLKLPLFK